MGSIQLPCHYCCLPCLPPCPALPVPGLPRPALRPSPADVVPANMKSSALIYVKAHLEPLVNQVGGWVAWRGVATCLRGCQRCLCPHLALPACLPACLPALQGDYVLVLTSRGAAKLPSM